LELAGQGTLKRQTQRAMGIVGLHFLYLASTCCLQTSSLLSEFACGTPSPEVFIGQVNSKYLTLRHPNGRSKFLDVSLGFSALPCDSVQYTVCALVAVLAGLSSPGKPCKKLRATWL